MKIALVSPQKYADSGINTSFFDISSRCGDPENHHWLEKWSAIRTRQWIELENFEVLKLIMKKNHSFDPHIRSAEFGGRKSQLAPIRFKMSNSWSLMKMGENISFTFLICIGLYQFLSDVDC